MDTHLLICEQCDNVFDASELVIPIGTLDDDYADHGGNTPCCGENSLSGKVSDYELDRCDINSLLQKEERVSV